MSWNGFADALDAFNKRGAFLFVFTPLRNFVQDQSAMFARSKPSKLPRGRSTVPPSQSSQSSQSEHGSSKQPLLSLLVDVWSREASDSRDKIYAFTSRHLTSSWYPELRPDYSLDVRCTFIRFVRIYINNESSLDFLKFAKGIGEPLPISGQRSSLDGNPRPVPLPNLLRNPPPSRQATVLMPQRRDPYHQGAPGASDLQQQETANRTAPVDADIDLPSWVCDWRKQAQRPDIPDVPGQVDEHYFDIRAKYPPMRQSIYDFSNQLVLRGCALARVARHEIGTLGAFLTLPKCALEKAMVRTETGPGVDDVPRQSQLSGISARNDGPPKSSMAVLLLQTLLHDETGCGCGNNTPMKEGETDPADDTGSLKARCQHAMYPRSRVCSLDWVFVLDVFAKPVILRPRTASSATSDGRSKVGFEFVSVCPLVVGSEREKWSAAPFAYGEVVIH